MTDGFLDERRRALEESFFHKRNAELMQQLRLELERESKRKKMATISGISNVALLDRFISLDLQPDTVAALALVPLVRVAWADDRLEPKESAAILASAVTAGIQKGSASYRCLESWLDQKPDEELNEAWTLFVQELSKSLSPEDRKLMQAGLLDRAQQVAEAAGGFLGLGHKVSEVEQQVLDELAAVFG